MNRIFSAIILFILFSCTDDLSLTDQEVLVSSGWKIDYVLKDGARMNSSCMEDDCYTFRNDGSFSISRGNIYCVENEPASGSYWFYDKETIVINYNGERIYYKIFVYSKELILVNELAGSRMVYDYVKCQ
ncbi:MAG TPA: hypothetical protein VHO68_08445 [Bacteroidales bacterium]|nr:hypothetical protein [Bacteroidales bacterium]